MRGGKNKYRDPHIASDFVVLDTEWEGMDCAPSDQGTAHNPRPTMRNLKPNSQLQWFLKQTLKILFLDLCVLF